MAFLHFDNSIEIMNDIKIKNYKKSKRYLADSLGFVLAQDIIADHNSPDFPTSAMDGYALKHKDLEFGRLKISSINPAGSELHDEVRDGYCIKTFTGSLMPQGADTLIPIENVTVDGEGEAFVDGTPRFMAPEIVRGEAKPSTQTDLFSLAVLLFYLFMMHHPLNGKREWEIHCLDLPAMRKLYGTEPVIIFDPNGNSD